MNACQNFNSRGIRTKKNFVTLKKLLSSRWSKHLSAPLKSRLCIRRKRGWFYYGRSWPGLRPGPGCARYNVHVWCDINDSIVYGALMHSVGIFKHVYRQTLENLSNYCDSFYIYSAIWLHHHLSLTSVRDSLRLFTRHWNAGHWSRLGPLAESLLMLGFCTSCYHYIVYCLVSMFCVLYCLMVFSFSCYGTQTLSYPRHNRYNITILGLELLQVSTGDCTYILLYNNIQ